MNRLLIMTIAVLCGGVSACLYLALLLSSPGAMILVYLTQLPLFFAGLWFGVAAAAIAGLSGAAVLFAASDLLAAAIFAALNAVPVVVLVRQALLARRDTEGAVVWYPPGRLTLWVAGLGIGGIGVALLLLGGPESLQATLRDVIGHSSDEVCEMLDPARPRPGRRNARRADPRHRGGVLDGHGGHQRRSRAGAACALWPRLAALA